MVAAQSMDVDTYSEVMALPDDTLKARKLYDLYATYRYRRNDSTTVVYASLQALNKRIDDPVAQGDEQVVKAILVTLRQDRNAVMTDLIAAERLYKRADHIQRLAEVSYWMTSISRILGNYSFAAEKAMTALAGFEAVGSKVWQARTYTQLAQISNSANNRKKGEEFGELAIKLARESGDELVYANACEIQAGLLFQMNFLDRALDYANEALRTARRLDLRLFEIRALEKRFLIYRQSAQFAKALEDHNTLVRLAPERMKEFSHQINMSELYLRTGDAARAKTVLLDAKLQMDSISASADVYRKVYAMLIFTEAGPENYDSVKHYFNLMSLEMDKLQEEENVQTILDLETKYETEKKDIQIENQDKTLSRQRLQLYGGGLFLLLALAAGAIFYRLSVKLRKRNAENERLVKEKETLIGEIHHRVKNNLQVISSLLQIQSRSLAADDDQARAALEESKSRVQAMGLIHQKLYQNDNMTTVAMVDYLTELGETLLDAYRLNDRVEVYYDVENVELDVDTAIPLGLIVNELVANALKYAFPGDHEGIIDIILHRDGKEFVLTVSDDGVGKAAAPKLASSTSFGGNLVELLSKKLRAQLHTDSDKGYATTLRFST